MGDVSELDVRLAAVNAGQLENIALDDSLAALGVLLSLQLQMGLTGDAPAIALADSLIAPADSDRAGRREGEFLPVAAATDLEKNAGGLRRKDMFDGRSFNTARVELKRGGETLTFDKSKGKDGKDVWKNAAGKEVDTAKVEDLLTKLSNIRAQLFQERVDPVLKMPTLVATLKLDNNMTETVTFARNGNAVLANRTDEPGSATVEVMAFNDAMTAIDAVK